jgi:hypothetical protein
LHGGSLLARWSGRVDSDIEPQSTKETEMNTKGAMIAAAVAGMFMSATPATAADKPAGKVHCAGVNSCKGQGACHSADNGCKGQNGCKGKGWVELGDKACKAKGGTVAGAPEKPVEKK